MYKKAIVMGSSFSGLCAARILNEFFEEVWILEKDALDASSRRGVPQYLHSHVLLARGFSGLNALFPELEHELLERGALKTDIGTYARWYQWGGWKRNFPMGIGALSCSRALLETALREQVLALPGVHLLTGHKVTGLVSQGDSKTGITVNGVHVQTPNGEKTLEAEMVMDCSGRGSHAPKWLTDLGYSAPRASEIPARVGYVTCKYNTPVPDPLEQQALIISPAAPREQRAGLVLPIENHQWSVTVAGWCSDHPEPTHEDLIKFAQSLPVPDLYQLLVKAEPVGEPVRHLIPSSIRRHYEKLRAFPKGFLVMGDALCSFNPTYGQGITVAVLQAEHLQECLSESQGELKDLWRWFFKRIQPAIQTAWSMVELEDSRFFPEHPLSPAKKFLQRYLTRVHRAATQDHEVSRAFYQVLNMKEPPQALFHPRVLWRVLLFYKQVGQTAPVYQRSSRL
ncbi:NAD(P)/FAD-dependent oxidoreductase [Deinococcus cellulosilyticus]|nr:FAD-binding monooxygenase [Deinococcus cellulosilyticus]